MGILGVFVRGPFVILSLTITLSAVVGCDLEGLCSAVCIYLRILVQQDNNNSTLFRSYRAEM